MDPAPSITEIARVIQLAVAPVFLLSGVGVFLTLLANRLARVIDRSRTLEEHLPAATAGDQADVRGRLATLAHRARLISLAIALGTCCALLVCTVVAALFLGAFLTLDVSAAVAVLFITAMMAFIGALIAFLREVFLATASLRIGGAAGGRL
jgi:hypothetical protein